MKDEQEQIVTVAVELTVRVRSRWNDDCTLGQLRRQASEEAQDLINRLYEGASATCPLSRADKERIALSRVETKQILWRNR